MKKRIFLGALVIILNLPCLAACGQKEATAYFASETEQSAVADGSADEIKSDKHDEKDVEAREMHDSTQKTSTICVYICGRVASPGVYELEEGSRICDLVELAGGMLNDASQSFWNLAEVLEDGQMVYVPTEEEADSKLLEKSKEQETEGSENVNINTATREELMTLSGIGESKADSIIDYRNENGNFTNTEDIMNVSGIGKAMYNKIKDDITVN